MFLYQKLFATPEPAPKEAAAKLPSIPPEQLASLQKSYQDKIAQDEACLVLKEVEWFKPISDIQEEQQKLAIKIGFLENQCAFLEAFCTFHGQITQEAYNEGLNKLAKECILQAGKENEAMYVKQVMDEATAYAYAALSAEKDFLSSDDEYRENYSNLLRQHLRKATLEQRKLVNLKALSSENELQEKHLLISRRIKFLHYQLLFVKAYKSFGTLEAAGYEKGLKQTIGHLTLDYKNLIAARNAQQVNDKVVLLDKAGKAALIKKHEVRLQKEGERYGFATLQIGRASLSELACYLETLRNDIKTALKDYETLTEQKTPLTRLFYERKEHFLGTLEALKAQSAILDKYACQAPNAIDAACMQGDIVSLKSHIHNSASIIKQKAPYALHLACRFGQAALVKYLLSLGVDVNREDEQGYYPVHYAAMSCQENISVEILASLKAKGADIAQKARAYGRTALHSACLFGDKVTVKWLLAQHSALIHQVETGRLQKNSALHNAAYAGLSSICAILLEANANPRLRNHSQHTPLMEAFVNPALPIQKKLVVIQLFQEQGLWLSPHDMKLLQQHPAYPTNIYPLLKLLMDSMVQTFEPNYLYSTTGLDVNQAANQTIDILPGSEENLESPEALNDEAPIALPSLQPH